MAQAVERTEAASARERILEGAMELFARHGYGGTPVSAICRRAGVAAPALYWHFESKEGLLAAALDRASATWTERIEADARAGRDGDERLDRLIAGLRELVEQHLDALALLLSTTLHSDLFGPTVRASMDRVNARATESLVRGLEETVGHRVPDADLVAFTVLAHVDAIAVVARRERPSGPALDRLFEHTRAMIAFAATRAVERAEGGSA